MDAVARAIDAGTADGCGNCRFWAGDTPGGEAGVCRRRAPTPLMVGLQQTLTGQRPAINGYFPPTHRTIWCGEHLPIASPRAN